MIAPYIDEQHSTGHIVVRPNRSLSWRGNQIVIASIAVVSLLIAGGFASLGYWMMLPFAGLELAALTAGLYVCARRLGHCEVIDVSGDKVSVESGYRRPQQRVEMLRAWVRVAWESRGHRSGLFLRSQGREVEVGACLSEEEKRLLERQLRALIQPQGQIA